MVERKPFTTTDVKKTVELILRTVISVNQLSIYGAVAGLCNESDLDYAESEICGSLVTPTESANANTTSQSSTSSAQGNLLQDYFEKIAELPEDQKLSKFCKAACFFLIEKGQFFITIHIALICYTLMRGSSCAFHKIVIPSLVPRHVTRPAQYPQQFVLSFTCLYFFFAHRLRLKVEHVGNTLRRFTRPQR